MGCGHLECHTCKSLKSCEQYNNKETKKKKRLREIETVTRSYAKAMKLLVNDSYVVELVLAATISSSSPFRISS